MSIGISMYVYMYICMYVSYVCMYVGRYHMIVLITVACNFKNKIFTDPIIKARGEIKTL